MKFLSFAAAAALAVAASGAQAVTVQATQIDDATISVGAFTVDGSNPAALDGQNINGQQLTFAWDLNSGNTGEPGASAAIRFSLPGAARITFDDYSTSDEESPLVLYQLGGGPVLTGPGGPVTNDAGPLVQGIQRDFVGGTGSSTAVFTPSASPIFDGINGPDDFEPGASGNDWVLGFYDNGTPIEGSMSFTISAVPLPASAWLLLAGVGAIAWRSRRKPA